MDKDSSEFDYFDQFLEKTFGEGPIDPDNYSGEEIRKIRSIRERMGRINRPRKGDHGLIQESDPRDRGTDPRVGGSDQRNRPEEQTVSTPEQTEGADRPRKNSLKGFKIAIVQDDLTLIARTPFRRKLLHYLLSNGNLITSYASLSQEVGGKTMGLRKAFDHFEKYGILTRETVRTAEFQGLKVTLQIPEKERQELLQKLGTDPGTDPGGQMGTHGGTDPLLDRKKDNILSIREKLLSWTDNQMAEWFPNLYAANFRSASIKQVLEELEKRCKTIDLIPKSLEYAEWEIANDRMVDKEGKPVTNPQNYLYVSLINKGMYRRHPDYVDPQEQALKEEQARLEKIREEKLALEEKSFQTWRESLSEAENKRLEEERTKAEFVLPKEAFLRKTFKALDIDI